LPCNAMLICHRVVSVGLSRLCFLCKQNKHIFLLFHRRVATSFQFFHTKHYDNIPTKTSLMAASNARGVGKVFMTTSLNVTPKTKKLYAVVNIKPK